MVRLVDVNGNTVPTSGTQVTATLASGAGTLGGTLTATTANGVATFTNLALTGTAGNYTINFSSAALTSVTTGAIALSAGAPASLAFVTQPSTVASGAAISPAVTVRVLDGAGNLVPTATNSISVGIGTNPGGAALSGTTTVSAVAGVATFNSLSLDKTGTGYTLAAASTGLSGATSGAFNVTPGAATKLVYSAQPSTVLAGAAISPAVVVQVQDAASNVVTSAGNAVTIAIGTNPGGSTLGGTVTVNAVAGVATFSTLSLNKVGTGYTLAASSGGLTGATSAAFNVNPGAAAALAVTSQPTTGQSGVVLVTPLVVRLVDGNGNTVPSTGTPVTASLASGAGTLGGTVGASTVSGVATFTGLVLTGTTGNYTINLGSPALTSATTGAIALSAGAPAAVAFQVQPSNVTSGAPISPAVAVRILDGAGNLVPTATNAVTMSIGNNPGTSTLGGTLSVAAVAGVATFSNLTLDKTGAGYTLAAASAGLTGATSGAFNVTPGAATKLVYSTQPSTATAGVAIAPAVVVQVQDANNNVVTGSTAAVSLALAANPGGSTLGGTSTVNAIAGVATFSTLTLNKAAAGYTLAASSGLLAGATSAAFTVNPGVATALAITTAPTTGQSGVTLSPQPVHPPGGRQRQHRAEQQRHDHGGTGLGKRHAGRGAHRHHHERRGGLLEPRPHRDRRELHDQFQLGRPDAGHQRRHCAERRGACCPRLPGAAVHRGCRGVHDAPGAGPRGGRRRQHRADRHQRDDARARRESGRQCPRRDAHGGRRRRRGEFLHADAGQGRRRVHHGRLRGRAHGRHEHDLLGEPGRGGIARHQHRADNGAEWRRALTAAGRPGG